MDSTPEATVPQERSSDNGGAHHARTSPSGPIKPMLTEEMLARFASRAASYDRGEPFLGRRLRRASQRQVSSDARAHAIRRLGHDSGGSMS